LKLASFWNDFGLNGNGFKLWAANKLVKTSTLKVDVNFQFLALDATGVGPLVPCSKEQQKLCKGFFKQCKAAGEKSCAQENLGKAALKKCVNNMKDDCALQQKACVNANEQCKLAIKSLGGGTKLTFQSSKLAVGWAVDEEEILVNTASAFQTLLKALAPSLSCGARDTKLLPGEFRELVKFEVGLKMLPCFDVDVDLKDVTFSLTDSLPEVFQNLAAPVQQSLEKIVPMAAALHEGGSIWFGREVSLPEMLPVVVYEGGREASWQADFVLEKDGLINGQPLWRASQDENYCAMYYNSFMYTMRCSKKEEQMSEKVSESRLRSHDLLQPPMMRWMWGSDDANRLMFQVQKYGDSLLGTGGVDSELRMGFEATHPLVFGTLGKGKSIVENAAELALRGLVQSLPRGHTEALALAAQGMRKDGTRSSAVGSLQAEFHGGTLELLLVLNVQKFRLVPDLQEPPADLKHGDVELRRLDRSGKTLLPMQLNAPFDRPPFATPLDTFKSDLHADISFNGSRLSINSFFGTTIIDMGKIDILADEVSPIAQTFIFGAGLAKAKGPSLSEGERYLVWLNCGFLRFWKLTKLTIEKLIEPSLEISLETVTSIQIHLKCVFIVAQPTEKLPTLKKAREDKTNLMSSDLEEVRVCPSREEDVLVWEQLLKSEWERNRNAISNFTCEASNPKALPSDRVAQFDGSWATVDVAGLVGKLLASQSRSSTSFWRASTLSQNGDVVVVR